MSQRSTSTNETYSSALNYAFNSMIDGWIKIKPTHKFGSYPQQEIATERESNSLIVIR